MRPHPRAHARARAAHSRVSPRVRHRADGERKYLTKGDNNAVNDRGLYNEGQMWLSQSEMMGRAVAFLPHVGMVTILLTDYPMLKFLLIGIMGLFVVTTRE